MYRKTVSILFVVTLMLSVSVIAQNREAQKAAYDSYQAKLKAAENYEEKIKLSGDFVNNNPGSSYVVSAFRFIKDDVLAADGNADRAVELINGLMPKLTAPNSQNFAKFILLQCYGKSSNSGNFQKVAEEFLASVDRNKGFYMRSVAKSAVSCKEFDYALTLLDKAEELYKKDAEEKTDRQRDFALRLLSGVVADKGCALSAAGRYKEAIVQFERAAKKSDTDVLGMPQLLSSVEGEPLHYWGLALKETGDVARGTDYMAYAALIKRNDEAQADLKKLYSEVKGNADNFAQYLTSKHDELSKPVPNFTLNDLKGNKVSSQTFKDRVTLIYIWSHT